MKVRLHKMWEARIVRLLYCPLDPVLGIALYRTPVSFPRRQFLETLAEGFWPDGCEVEIALDYLGDVTSWRVSGCYIHEICSDRVAVSEFINDKYAKLKEITNV